MRPSFPGKTNFVIHEGRDRRGDSVVYLISRLPGRTPSEKNLHQYRHRSTREGGGRYSATIYSINHFGFIPRDFSARQKLEWPDSGEAWRNAKRTIRMKYNGADKNFSGQKRTRAFPRPPRRPIHELASQSEGNHSSINYIVFPPLSLSLPLLSFALKS